MSTVLKLPNAFAPPLTPRRANVGKLPKGIARFSKAKRERDAQHAAVTTEPTGDRYANAFRMIREAREQGRPAPPIEVLLPGYTPPRGAA